MVDNSISSPTPLADLGLRESPLLLTAPQAAALCSTSLRTWRTWDAAGKIPMAIRIGGKVLWRSEELRAWVEAGCPDRETWEAMQPS